MRAAHYFTIQKNEQAPIFKHQGTDPWRTIRSHDLLLPDWLSIIIICICLSLSALFSGLNLGLMSLDRTELKVNLNDFATSMIFYCLMSKYILDFAKHWKSKRKKICKKDSASTRSWQLFVMQYFTWKCNGQFDSYHFAGESYIWPCSCRRFDFIDCYFW